MFECPTCKRQFETRRGLGVHHSSVHGERLPNRECNQCGAEFYSSYQKKYCSTTCLKRGTSFQGEDAPNYRGAKKETQCEICGESFEYYPCDKEGIYCASCVENEQWRDPPIISGSDHPRWQGGKVTIECTVCTGSIERYPSEVGDVVVCGEDCRRRWLSESFTGEGHPNWKGGDTGPYGKGWAAIRRQALERDGYRCVHCGTAKGELGRNPDVHHLIPVRAFAEADGVSRADAHVLENVVSLCLPCHRRAEFGQIGVETLRSAAGLETSPAVDSLTELEAA